MNGVQDFYLLLKHYLPNTLPEAHVTLTTVSYRRAGPTCTLIISARLQQITNTPLKPIARNPGSGLCRPINAEHLLYGGSVLHNQRAGFLFFFGRKAASCLLWREKACDGALPLNHINPFCRDSFSGFPGETGTPLFLLEPRRFFLPNLTEGSEGNRGPTRYHLLEQSN